MQIINPKLNMNREQKIKALQLIKEGTTPKQAVKLAEMPETMVVIGREEAERVKAEGFTGNLIIVLVRKNINT